MHFALHMQISKTLEIKEIQHIILPFVNILQSQSHLINLNYSMYFISKWRNLRFADKRYAAFYSSSLPAPANICEDTFKPVTV